MIIAVHTTPPTPPTHPHTNSTSTRNKGPSGLKFCMRPHLTKLTITQHNFNPTFLGGGGGVLHPHPWTNPIQFFLQKNFPSQIFINQIFSTQIIS